MAEAIEAMKGAFAAFSAGRSVMPPRIHLDVETHSGVSLIMPAYANDGPAEALATKVVSLFPGNPARGLAFIQAAVMVFEPDTGRPAAILEGSSLTAIRTGAASGAATDLLANADARTAAIFGSGVQARTQLLAACTARNLETAWIYSRTPESVDAMIGELAGMGPIPSDLRRAGSPREALAEADIVCTATASSDRPVFADADLKPGAHLNAVGSFQPQICEIPPETVERAWVVVDSREAAREEAGDLIQVVDSGRIGWDHIQAELGEIAEGTANPPAAGDERPTLFKSVGLAVQDAFAAQVALTNATANGLGTEVAW